MRAVPILDHPQDSNSSQHRESVVLQARLTACASITWTPAQRFSLHARI